VPQLLIDAIIAGAILAAAYLGGCVYLYRRLFVPGRSGSVRDFEFTPFEFQVDHEEIDLTTADGTRFGLWLLRQPGNPQVVIVSPGHKGRRQDVLGVSVALWRKGFNVLCYSYRGMPGSDRAAVTLGIKEVQELGAAIAYARGRVRDARIGLLGYSMGASVSLLAAAGDPTVAALVLDSPFADLRQELIESVRRACGLPGQLLVTPAGWWLGLRSGARLADASPISVLSGLEPRPLFFIHGGDDKVTDVRHSRLLHDSYRGPREIWVVQGAAHAAAYFDDRQLYVERVAGFFSRHLGLSSHLGLRLLEEDEEVS